MKKRLLMPSRGKAWGGRGVGAVRCPCVLCSCVHDARRVAQGSPMGQSTRAGPHPASPLSPPFLCHWAEDQGLPHRPPNAGSFLGASGSRIVPSFPAQCPVSGLSSLVQPWRPRRLPVLSAIAL